MNSDSFQAAYCRLMAVAPADYRADLLRRTVYPHARPFLGLLTGLDPHHFQADYEFIDDVGDLYNVAGFPEAVDCYIKHYSNRDFLRRVLRLRVSVRRMWQVLAQVFPADAPRRLQTTLREQDSLAPFGRKTGRAGEKPAKPAGNPSI